jgi:hypothetical protein
VEGVGEIECNKIESIQLQLKLLISTVPQTLLVLLSLANLPCRSELVEKRSRP